MSSSSSSSTSSASTSVPPKVTINEKVNLTKEQNEVLQMICNSYDIETFVKPKPKDERTWDRYYCWQR